jgi:hypothetical protein
MVSNPGFRRAGSPSLRFMRLHGRAGRKLLDDTGLKALIKGTIVATLLLAAQEGETPWHEAVWVLIGGILTTVVAAYAAHISSHDEGGVRAYLGGLGRNLLAESPRFFAALPTVILLVFAAMLHWHDDHQNPDGSVSVGYTTILGNVNVALLFIWGVVAARRGGFSPRWTLLIATMNAALGLIIVTAEFKLH